jgi:hypothetical protein
VSNRTWRVGFFFKVACWFLQGDPWLKISHTMYQYTLSNSPSPHIREIQIPKYLQFGEPAVFSQVWDLASDTKAITRRFSVSCFNV